MIGCLRFLMIRWFRFGFVILLCVGFVIGVFVGWFVICMLSLGWMFFGWIGFC